MATAPGTGLELRNNAVRARARRSDQSGRRHDVSETFAFDPALPAHHRHSQVSALARARAWISEQRRALHLDKTRVGERLTDVTLGDWLRRYRSEFEDDQAKPLGSRGQGHVRKKSASKEANTALGWEARFPNLCALPPSDITPKHLREAMKVLAEKHHLAAGTVNRWLAVLSAVYKAAVEEWGFDDVVNPAYKLRRAQGAGGRDRLIDHAEFARIMKALDGASLETRKAIEFLRWTGCRRSEAVGLTWKDVDWSKPIVEVTFRDTKDPRGRKRQRTIPLASEAEAVLRSLFDGTPPPKGRPFPVHPDSLTTAWGRACAKVTPMVKNARVHDLRHTRITEVTARLPLMDAQRISGHIDLRMLQRYYHPTAQAIGKRWLEAEKAEGKGKKAGPGDDAAIDALIERAKTDTELKRRLMERMLS